MSVFDETILRIEFFRSVFNGRQGHVCIAYAKPHDKKSFKERFFEWPDEADELASFIESKKAGHNIWFCPQLLEYPRRKKQAIKECDVVWADLDTCPPDLVYPKPPILLESSPGRFQAIWPLSELIESKLAEELSKRVAYAYVKHGADKGGWDLTQLLRVPHTTNYKYIEAPNVGIINAYDIKVDYSLFLQFKRQPDESTPGMPDLIDEDDLPRFIGPYKSQFTAEFNELFYGPYDSDGDWSKALWRLLHLCFGLGMPDDVVLAVGWHSAVNKYARDDRPIAHLWQDVTKAKREHRFEVLGDPDEIPQIPQLVDEAIELPDNFAARYTAWAASQTDAAVEYHEACAFVMLSAILAENVRLPLSIGPMIPNIWLMILADTTLTRKSTAMDMAVEMISEVYDDIVLATDGSVEGLLQSLAVRGNKSAIFHRDEFTGLMESMSRKDYMAGMFETFTRAYDGKQFKRMLKKEVIHVRDPIFIMLCGGIRSKMQHLITEEHVASGFIPRFIVVSADPNPEAFMPVKKRTDDATEERDALIEELQVLKSNYIDQVMITVQGKAAMLSSVKIEGDISEEALAEYNRIENLLREAAMGDPHFSPVFDRMGKTLLKLAILIAASRQEPVDFTFAIDKSDIQIAAVYMQRWGIHIHDLVKNTGMSEFERKLTAVLKSIEAQNGVFRSTLTRKHRLSAQEADMIFNTLSARGQVAFSRKGKGTKVWLHDTEPIDNKDEDS